VEVHRWGRRELLPRNAGPPFDGGLERAQAGGVLDELQCGAHGVGSGGIAMHVERDNRAKLLWIPGGTAGLHRALRLIGV
jgi:hypothetical protein